MTTLKKMGYAKSEINDVILVMLAMTENELTEVIAQDDANVLELANLQGIAVKRQEGLSECVRGAA